MVAAIVFAAAELTPTLRLRARLSQMDHKPFVVAADGGASTAMAFGMTPDVVIGDLDSIDPATLERVQQAHVPIERFPRDKDATDGQLAIARALQMRPDELWLLGFLGGPRLDQALANVLLLAGLDAPAVVLDERNEARVVRPDAGYAFRTEPGEVISLIPIRGDATGVRTQGLRWPLDGETLKAGDTRGVSNEPTGGSVHVAIEHGVLLVTRHFAE